MKRRVVRKVEGSQMASKICELQRDICEHERFLGDLLVMLARPTQDRQFIKHGTKNCDYFEFVWDRVCKLLKDNEDMAQELRGKTR